MANNPELYNAAFSGALAGMIQNRVQFASYAAIAAGCAAFATTVDAAIAYLPQGVNTGLSNLMSQICRSALSNCYTTNIPVSIITNVLLAFNACSPSLITETDESPIYIRNVITGNIANLAVYPVIANPAVNDNVTNVQNDLVCVARQAAPAQNGIYSVGPVVAGNAALTRVSWWAANARLTAYRPTLVIEEGDVFNHTSWQAMCEPMGFVVGIDDPHLLPTMYYHEQALVLGTTGAVPTWSDANSNFTISNLAPAGTPSVLYEVLAGGNTITINGRDALLAIQVLDTSLLRIGIFNNNHQ